MIRVDENDPVDEVQLSFPPRDVQIKKGIDPKKQYDLLNEIGRGKFGTVYKCIENSTGLALAAKFISCPKKEDRKNVEQEIDIMRSLQHPRLIQLYDAFENNKVMCVVLELIEGGELFERVIDDDFVLTEKSCTVFMRQICEGVDFIHKQRILHLDMKPENILCLTRTGNRIKIIDFGLARRFDPNKKLQVLFGTPEFVAPEVVNFDQIGYGTDLWSVGVICYVLLSGLSPFMGATDVETMANVTIAKYDFDDEAFQEISENAKDFIRRLLVKDINQRMSTQDCLNHEWLLKKKTCRSYSMDVTKDNLKQFVERWNEHPNSPYMFETTSHLITDSHQLSGSLYSLVGMSPSPCGSLASSSDHDNDYLTTETKDNYSNLDYLRRSSDSTCIMKGPDVYERINLAEEIRKLTNRLFQISNITTSFTNNNQLLSSSESLKINHFNNDTNDSINNTNCETKLLKELPKDHPQSPICGVPWRKGKNRLNNMSRDVPLPLKTDMKQTQNETESNSRRQSLNSNPTKTKDLLLRLLEQWDGPRNPIRPNTRHKSISTEWNENDSLGQRTISSLNNFFHSRNKTKKTTNFHTQN